MKSLVLLTAVMMASFGCAHPQQPERKIYVISEDASGVGTAYYKRCTTDCSKAYNECVDEQEEEARERTKKLEFSRADQAVEWLRKNKAEVALGTIVIIAGVAFVITTGGSGALSLAPLAL